TFVTNHASAPINGKWIIVFVTLKLPRAKANVISGFRFNCDCKQVTQEVNNTKNTTNIMVPTKSNITSVNDTRVAATDAPIAANTAVIVVPKLSPINTGSAAFKSIAPSLNNP